ncbi:meiosis-specific nuclear structural protein 1-like [Saccostrea echinata]|uniref:meiosis-specific nuclear structural protein 1-like n=1 Tax=Saccostrea echinata TaxID=191078 RepID=UPI002A7EBAEA|nr:meiosis-specific nuclear structural protein 1-like [Saccostrea echinata]
MSSSSSSSSSSGSDSTEEVVVHRYLKQDLKSGVAQGRALLRRHGGIKAQPCHYQLRDCRHAVLDHKGHGYQGKHWETSVLSNNLEKSTRRLTINAVNREMDEEQKKRAFYEAETARLAKEIIEPLLAEYNDTITISMREMAADERVQAHHQEMVKDTVQGELVHKENAKRVQQMSEEEREYQIKLLMAMKDDAMKTASIDSLVDKMAETNYKRSLINTDLEEASERLQEDEKETNMEYNKAVGELLDQSLVTVVHENHRDMLREQAEQARQEKIKMQKNLENDKTAKHIQHKYSRALKKLTAMYHELESKDQKEEEALKQYLEDVKFSAQEDIVRMVSRKWTSRMYSEEKSRRIHEEEETIDQENPARNAMLNLMNRVQRQMMLQKFKGKWINVTNKKKSERVEKEENLSEHDRKLRMLRTKNRKETKVVSWQDEC